MPSTVTIRLYAELNDFVPRLRRARSHEVGVGEGRSVKDAIESLGVPHTEIAMVLVDGEPRPLHHQLEPGERIGAFPRFTSLAPERSATVGSEPPEPIRFVADGHLAALARLLRLMGFDTLRDDAWDDDRLAQISSREDRVLLTRDRGLLKRRIVEHGAHLWDDDPDDQLLDVVHRFGLAERVRPFTRCMVCNGVLVDVDKREVVDRLPPRTRAEHDRFRRCDACGQVYWDGSHLRRLTALVQRVREVTPDASEP